MKYVIAFAVALVFSGILSAQAADAPVVKVGMPTDDSIEQMQRMFELQRAAEIPHKAQLTEELAKAQLRVLATPQAQTQVAQYLHGLYQALMKEGFSKAEALQIVMHAPVLTPYDPGR